MIRIKRNKRETNFCSCDGKFIWDKKSILYLDQKTNFYPGLVCHVVETSLESLFLTTQEKTRCIWCKMQRDIRAGNWLMGRGKTRFVSSALLQGGAASRADVGLPHSQLTGCCCWDTNRSLQLPRLQSDASIIVSRNETSHVAFPTFHSCPVRSLVLVVFHVSIFTGPKTKEQFANYCFWLLFLLVSEDSSLWVWLFGDVVAAENNTILSIMILYDGYGAKATLSLSDVCWKNGSQLRDEFLGVWEGFWETQKRDGAG